MKIIVLAGGLSTERDVSLASGAGICKTLLEMGHDAYLLDVYLGLPDAPDDLSRVFKSDGHGLSAAAGISKTEPDLQAIRESRKEHPRSFGFFGPHVVDLCKLADITFMALHGGEGENGSIQAAFELLDIPYTGSDSLGCAVAMDKGLTKKIFMESGVSTPGGGTIHKSDKDKSPRRFSLDFPVVVKPCCGGSSIGVHIVHTEADYRAALEQSFTYEDEVVVEPYIKGREFACGILDGVALPPIEVIPKSGFFDYANKYQADASLEICPAQIDEETTRRMQEITKRAYHALKLSVYSRADFLLDESGQLYCLEMNTLPGMTSASLLPKEAAAAGIPYDELCRRIIEISRRERTK